MYTTLISVPQLQALMAGAQPPRIFDCSFELMKPHAGREQFLQAHIPGAVYADLDTDTTRNVDFRSFSEELTASYGGTAVQLFGEIGYTLPLGLSADDIGEGGFDNHVLGSE